jgi:acyl-CoA reductase-like NAD-dependent aldehyde dehydrogenase
MGAPFYGSGYQPRTAPGSSVVRPAPVAIGLEFRESCGVSGAALRVMEIFGPVLSVIAYDSEDDAIRIANDSKYGLHAAVLGTDLPRARRVASQLRAGRVVINGMTDDPQAPWGGFKFSGVGREYGRYGIEAFLEPRAILE